MRKLFATMVTMLVATGTVVATASASTASGERPPVCTTVTFNQNSGNGPVYREKLCGTIFKSEREDGVTCLVDGGPEGPGAISFCRFGKEDADLAS